MKSVNTRLVEAAMHSIKNGQPVHLRLAHVKESFTTVDIQDDNGMVSFLVKDTDYTVYTTVDRIVAYSVKEG